MCHPGFGSVIFHRQITLRRISSAQWEQLSQEFAINLSAPLHICWRRFCWASAQRNCFTLGCGSRPGWHGSFCSSYQVPVCCMCSRIIYEVGMLPSTFRDQAVGLDTLLPMNTVASFGT